MPKNSTELSSLRAENDLEVHLIQEKENSPSCLFSVPAKLLKVCLNFGK
jgi:hypothetical protein